MDRESFFAAWSALHGGAAVKGAVRGWLWISFAVVRPLAKLKVSPNSLTLLGGVLAIGVWHFAGVIYGLICLALSLMADGLDGSLAIVTGKTSKWGAVLDSVVDRISEFFWALAFYAVGAPVIVIGVAWLAALTQEYVRARAAGLGQIEITLVTIAERPVRAIILALALLGDLLSIKITTTAAIVWLVMQVYSLVMVARNSFTFLQRNN